MSELILAIIFGILIPMFILPASGLLWLLLLKKYKENKATNEALKLLEQAETIEFVDLTELDDAEIELDKYLFDADKQKIKKH